MDTHNIELIFNSLFLIYGSILIIIYMLSAILSIWEFRKYSNKNKYVDYKTMLSFQKIPSVSVLAPAYNEEINIVENIKSLVALTYPDYEVIIINDGSTDQTLPQLIKAYDLVLSTQAIDEKIKTAPVRGIYKSRNPVYNMLTVLDKENGGKSDALNAGINISEKELFMAIDVDCLLETDAIEKMVKPFIEDTKNTVIASGGVIRIINSCTVEAGKVVEVKYPKSWLAKFQILEYFRAFTLGRMAWSRINGLLIISGAFGLFDKQRVINIGGYDTETVGEDLELVVRLRRYMHEVEKQKYRVAFIPDPLCWTEVPENIKVLYRQRNRWTRGAIDTILKHKKMFFNPKYKLIGMLSFPNWVLFEWLGPIVEFIGVIYFGVLVYLGKVDYRIYFSLLIFVFSFSLMYSLFAVFFEIYTFNKYKGKYLFFESLLIIILELIIFQPMNMFFSLSGHFDYYFRRRTHKKWGKMDRVGFK